MNHTHTPKLALITAVLLTGAFAQAQYDGVQFYSTDVSGFDFTGMSMDGADFGYYVSKVTDAVFTDANINNANMWYNTQKGFSEAQWIQTANYKNKALTGGAFFQSNLSGWDFSGMDLRGNSFNQLLSGGLSGTDFSNSDIRGSAFDFAHSSGFTEAQLQSTASFKNKDLSGVGFRYSEIEGWNFSGQNLTGADFYAAILTKQNDSSVTANFTDAIINNANFGNSKSWTSGGADLTKEHIYSTASYKNKDVSGVNLTSNDLSTWDFSGQNMADTNLKDTLLTGADFTNAIIKNGNFESLRSYVSAFEGLSRAQLESTKSFQDKDLGSINLGGRGYVGTDYMRRDWGDLDLSGFNLQGASFTDAAISQINFAGANIEGANFRSNFERNSTDRNPNGLTAAQLYSTASYLNKNLKGIGLYGLDMEGWNLSGQDLSGAEFSFANLSNADFRGAIIKGASFSKTVEYGFTKEQLYSTASYISGDLSGINLTANDLTGWNFSGKDMTNASFGTATLTNADFTDTIIKGATVGSTGFTAEQLYSTASYKNKDLRAIMFNGLNLAGWDFTGQNLQNATMSAMSYANINLTNADMRGAYTLNVTNVDQAIMKNTIWSDGVVKNMELAVDEDFLVVKNYDAHIGAQPSSRNEYVITTKISDTDVIMTGGKLIIEAGAPLALVQHKSLTADGGQIVMNYGEDGFGVINVYGSDLGQSNFIITENTEYYIDFGVFGPDADEYLLVDATYGGNIVGDPENIKYSVWDNGVDVTEEWEFKLVGDQLKLVLVIPEASAYAAVLGLIAMAMAAYRRRR